MIVFIVFMVVVGLWLNRSIAIAAMGPDWFIELNHGDTIPKVDKALKAVKVLGLVFIAFVAPAMFLAGSLAALLLYVGALRSTVAAVELEYLTAVKELKEESELPDTPAVP